MKTNVKQVFQFLLIVWIKISRCFQKHIIFQKEHGIGFFLLLIYYLLDEIRLPSDTNMKSLFDALRIDSFISWTGFCQKMQFHRRHISNNKKEFPHPTRLEKCRQEFYSFHLKRYFLIQFNPKIEIVFFSLYHVKTLPFLDIEIYHVRKTISE